MNANATAYLYSTYFGGTLDELGFGGVAIVAIDASGDAYISGFTNSTNLPISPGAYKSVKSGGSNGIDIFVAKITPAGNGSADLIYSTLLGGSGGTLGLRDESSRSITVNAAGNAYVTGSTVSTDFDITAGAFQTTYGGGNRDAFVTMLDANGTALLYSTYLGGSGTASSEMGRDICVDDAGHIYVTGHTPSSTDFPITPDATQGTFGGGNYDGFVTKLNPAGNGSSDLVFSTFLGGSANDAGAGLVLDASGNAYVTGFTSSTDFDITTGAFQTNFGGGPNDAFVTKISIEPVLTQLSSEDCGRNVLMDDTLIADIVPGASEYIFLIENDTLGYSNSIISTNNTFQLMHLSPPVEYNTVYDVRIKIVVGSDTSAYGPICQVITIIGEKISCGTDLVLKLQLQSDSNLQELIDLQEEMIRNLTHNTAFVIPVVVHVVHLTTDAVPEVGTTNITYNQILSQIEALNAAYQATNSGLNTGIRFCLAEIPSGVINWTDNAEPGVMRYPDDILTDNEMSQSGTDALLSLTHSDYQSSDPQYFPFNKYLNIWVVRSIDGSIIGGYQGYAPLPIYPELGVGGWNLDGVVIKGNVFGDNTNLNFCQCFNLQAGRDQGKVLVHEVGHYLRLFHTFFTECSGMEDPGYTDDCVLFGDRICDTPPCKKPLSTGQFCSSLDFENFCSENITYTGYVSQMQFYTPFTDAYDLIEDYMYYVLDHCYETFTQGQIDRMLTFIQNFRSNLVSPQNLNDVGVAYPGGCIEPLLVADFDAEPSQACVNFPVIFTTPIGPGFSAVTWDWDFGDGTLLPGSTDPTPSNIYTATGLFDVILIAYDGFGNSETETMQIFVSDCTPIESTQGNWYFGRYAGLDFSTGIPVADQSAFNAVPQTIDALEGCVTVSDDQGDLLFYSDGVSVWNDDHEEITIFDLSGDISATQHLAVPFPGHPDQYYLFQMPWVGQTIFDFSIVDMSVPCPLCPGGGNGQVTAPTSITLPAGVNRVAESITAVPHCNGIDYWIIVHDFDSRNFLVYLLSSMGLTGSDGSSPEPDIYFSDYDAGYGQLKASPDGTKLSITNRVGGVQAGVVIYDFDNTSGIINNRNLLLSLENTTGVSFSPNSKLLYVSQLDYVTNQVNLYQFDLVMNTNTIIAVESINVYFWEMQLGPDSMIYLSKYLQDNLAVINDPNIVGTGSAYLLNGPDLDVFGQGIISRSGLPNMIDAKNPALLTPDFTINYTSCFDVEFIVDPCWVIYNQSWDFGDGNNTTNINPTHTYSSDGTYTVTLTLSIGTITLPSVSKNITIQSTVTAPTITGLLNVCLGGLPDEYSIGNFDPNLTYNWTVSNGTFTGPETGTPLVNVDWSSPGTATLTVIAFTNQVCPAGTTSVTVTVNSSPIINITSSSDCNGTCNGEATATVSGGTFPYNFFWQPGGQTTSSITGLCAGTYTLNVVDANGCSDQDNIIITVAPAITSAIITSSSNVSCNGANDGQATVSVSGGTAPWSYYWSTGAQTVGSYSPSNTILNLSGGTYSVNVTDVNGCGPVTASVTIIEPAPLNISFAVTDISCYGADDGSINSNVTGGSGTYYYYWGGPYGFSSGLEDISNLLPGQYSVIISDNGCASDIIFITINEPSPLSLLISSTDEQCPGSADGTATVVPSGGTSPYYYLWNNGQTTSTAVDLTSGNYSVIVTDNNGCIATGIAIIDFITEFPNSSFTYSFLSDEIYMSDNIW
ncbi:MAG: PKD domain-containing protein [Bacteroidota bacterium]